jgi:hypothetical protein
MTCIYSTHSCQLLALSVLHSLPQVNLDLVYVWSNYCELGEERNFPRARRASQGVDELLDCGLDEEYKDLHNRISTKFLMVRKVVYVYCPF